MTDFKRLALIAAVGAGAIAALPALRRLASDEHSFAPAAWMGVESRRDRVDKLKLAVGERLAAPGLTEYFLNKDLLYIFYQRWLPRLNVDPTPPKGVVVIVHGLGEHSSRYVEVARALNAAGLVVYALDHQGHGRSEGDRGFVRRFSDYGDDVIALTRLAKRENPGLKCFLLGHSMGGLISIDVLSRAQDEFTAAVVSAPPVKVDPSQVTPATVAVGKILSANLPRIQIDQLKIDRLCLAPTVVDLYVNDPLVHHGMLEARLGVEIITHAERATRELAPKIRIPIYMFHGTKDGLCAISGTEEFFAALPGKDKTFKRVEGGFHETMNENPAVVADVVNFIKSRL